MPNHMSLLWLAYQLLNTDSYHIQTKGIIQSIVHSMYFKPLFWFPSEAWDLISWHVLDLHNPSLPVICQLLRRKLCLYEHICEVSCGTTTKATFTKPATLLRQPTVRQGSRAHPRNGGTNQTEPKSSKGLCSHPIDRYKSPLFYSSIKCILIL